MEIERGNEKFPHCGLVNCQMLCDRYYSWGDLNKHSPDKQRITDQTPDTTEVQLAEAMRLIYWDTLQEYG